MTSYNESTRDYITSLFAIEDAALAQVREGVSRHGLPAIEITPEEGRFLQFLVRASGGRLALEIGALGGYSGAWIARGLVEGGRLITLEMIPHHADVARQHFALAGVADRVDVRVGNAHKLLPGLAAEGPFDFVFIDAEKDGYLAYFDWALENTRLGGIIAAHNALLYGSVARSGTPSTVTRSIQEFNRRVANEPRVISTIYPGGDGTLVAVNVGRMRP